MATSMTGIKKLSAALFICIFSTIAHAAQLPIPAGGVGYPNRIISVYDLFRDNLPSNLIGQATTDANGYYQFSIPYNQTDPNYQIMSLVYDTNGVQVPKVGFSYMNSHYIWSAGQHSYVSHNAVDGDPPVGMVSNGKLIIKGRAITFSNGTYGLYSCVTWAGGPETYCDPNTLVGTPNTVTINQLPAIPKTRAQIAAEIAENSPKPKASTISINQIPVVPKTRAQIAAENADNGTPKPRSYSVSQLGHVGNPKDIDVPPPPNCTQLKVWVGGWPAGNGGLTISNFSASCSFSIPNISAGNHGVVVEVNATGLPIYYTNSSGFQKFTVGSNGLMNGKVDYNATTQQWILTQTP